MAISCSHEQKLTKSKRNAGELRVNKHFIWILFWNKKEFTLKCEWDVNNIFPSIFILRAKSPFFSLWNSISPHQFNLHDHDLHSPQSAYFSAMKKHFFSARTKTVKFQNIFHAKSWKSLMQWYDAFYASISEIHLWEFTWGCLLWAAQVSADQVHRRWKPFDKVSRRQSVEREFLFKS